MSTETSWNLNNKGDLKCQPSVAVPVSSLKERVIEFQKTMIDGKEVVDLSAPYEDFDEIDEDEEDETEENPTKKTQSTFSKEEVAHSTSAPTPSLKSEGSTTTTKDPNRDRLLAPKTITGKKKRNRKKTETEVLRTNIEGLTKENKELRTENAELRQKLQELANNSLRNPHGQHITTPYSFPVSLAEGKILTNGSAGIGVELSQHWPQNHVFVPVTAFPPSAQSEVHIPHQIALPHTGVAAFPHHHLIAATNPVDGLAGAVPNQVLLQPGIAVQGDVLPHLAHAHGSYVQLPFHDANIVVRSHSSQKNKFAQKDKFDA